MNIDITKEEETSDVSHEVKIQSDTFKFLMDFRFMPILPNPFPEFDGSRKVPIYDSMLFS